MWLAVTRRVPASIDRCELTHLARAPIDYARAEAQHAAYEEALGRLGCRVQRLPDAPEWPDAVFVEDTAVVFDEIAVIARPGAASRRGEVDAKAAALRPHRRLAFIQPPGTLDGGDVLVTPPPRRAGVRGGDPGPGRVFVGISGRTNEEGARQLAAVVAPHGFEVLSIPVSGCLHLKSAVTAAFLPPEGGSHRNHQGKLSCLPGKVSWLPPSGGRGVLVVNPVWVDVAHFEGFELIEADPAEPMAANVLAIGDRVICAEEHPRTRQRLESQGFITLSVPAGELAKAEGGVTCCSVILSVAADS
jgi:dimethylargininase